MRVAGLLGTSTPEATEGPEVLVSRTGHRATPAFVHVAGADAVVGAVARERRFSHAGATVRRLL
jgi:hypothetical protein